MMVTNIEVRDMIIQLYFEANRDHIANMLEAKHGSTDDSSVKHEVTRIIKSSFESSGANFDDPTKDQLYNVVRMLKMRSALGSTDLADIRESAKKLTELIDQL